MKMIFAASIVLFSTIGALASGHEVRNGGAAVVCYAADGVTKNSIELFDYWEMKTVLGDSNGVDLGPETLSVSQKIELFAKRLDLVDPDRATRYRQTAQAIFTQMHRVLRDDLGATPIDDDRSAIPDPQGPCKKELFAVQIRLPAPGATRFMIRRDLYDSPLTSNTTRAGIILHEIVYRDAISQGHLNSDEARRFHYVIASNFNHAPSLLESYQFLLEQVNFRYLNSMPLFSSSFGRTILIQAGRPCLPSSVECRVQLQSPERLLTPFVDLAIDTSALLIFDQNKRLLSVQGTLGTRLSGKVKLAGSWFPLGPWHELTLFSDGQVQNAYFEGEVAIEMPRSREPLLCKTHVIFEEIQNYGRKERVFKSCILSADTYQGWFPHFGRATFARDSSITFHRGWLVSDGVLAAQAELPVADTAIMHRFVRTVWFNEQGYVEQGAFADPIEIEILGSKELISDFWDGNNGQAKTMLRRRFSSPRIQGLLIEARNGDIADSFCGEKGFAQRTPSHLFPPALGQVTRTLRKFITGQETYSNLRRLPPRLVTDEEVVQVQEIECSGAVEFSF
jgi:hypothetical protein